jgi:RNA polymerase sigma factor (sigma-70 family)
MNYTVADWIQEGEIVLFRECFKKGIEDKGLIRTILYRRLIDVARKQVGRKKGNSIKDTRFLGVYDIHGQEDKNFDRVEIREALFSLCETKEMREKMKMRLEEKTLKEIAKAFNVSEGLVSRQFSQTAH